MSTEHQQYSTENQLDRIKQYAAKLGMEIVRVFADEGKSGLSVKGRESLRGMIAEAHSTVVALYGATAGQVSFVSSRLTTNQAVCALVPKKGFEFFNYLTMRAATAELENKAVGSAQQNISKGIVEETQTILPPSHLIEQFTAVVGPLFDRWIANLHQSRTLAALRDTLLPKLLSGELRVKAADSAGSTSSPQASSPQAEKRAAAAT